MHVSSLHHAYIPQGFRRETLNPSVACRLGAAGTRAREQLAISRYLCLMHRLDEGIRMGSIGAMPCASEAIARNRFRRAGPLREDFFAKPSDAITLLAISHRVLVVKA